MMRSLFSAVSGLRTHQTRMDVIGNNIANVNTPGFKMGRVTFQELFSQTLRGASAPTGSQTNAPGGTNPVQIGMGVGIASVDTIHTAGNLQPTSRLTDVAIEGKGFFVVHDGNRRAFTRVGAFDIDGDGTLVDSSGRKVLGWVPDASGNLPSDRTSNNLKPISIVIGSTISASATSRIEMGKNLDAEASVGDVRSAVITAFDSLGRGHDMTLRFTKTGVNEWSWSLSRPEEPDVTGTIQFDGTGKCLTVPQSVTAHVTGANDLSLTIDFSGITQVAGPSTAEPSVVDGYPSGTLESFTFDSAGVISGFYSNGRSRVLGQLAIANFPNPSGLMKIGKNLYVESNNSGNADAGIGPAGTAGRGTIAPSSLEMSNVDLAEEFTQLIITQRGFQANSRVITASDEMLQDLVNLKR